jgi:hypothetical protein
VPSRGSLRPLAFGRPFSYVSLVSMPTTE